MRKYLSVIVPLGRHSRCPYLAQTNPVPPAASLEDEPIWAFLYFEGRALQMTAAKGLTYGKFFSYDLFTQGAGELFHTFPGA